MIAILASPARLALKMDGHANAMRNEQDHDLVCCAASILLQTMIRSCQLYPGITVEGNAAIGKADILLKHKNTAEEAAKHRYQMTLDGLEMLAKTYPQSVWINYE